jgi:cytochrome o ubiquinol oxidase subunit 2
MSGMETQMHAVINEKGVFDGFSANYSGHGFSKMHFKFHGLDTKGFNQWVEKVRSSDNQTLNHQGYLALEEKTAGHPVTYFSSIEENLYHDILNRCVDANTACLDKLMHQNKYRAKHAVKHKE